MNASSLNKSQQLRSLESSPELTKEWVSVKKQDPFKLLLVIYMKYKTKLCVTYSAHSIRQTQDLLGRLNFDRRLGNVWGSPRRS